MVWQLFKQLLIFPKGLFGGVIAATVMWAVIIFSSTWHATTIARKMGYEGPVAVAGGWQYLVHVPWVIALLCVAFGIGFYLAVSWVARHP